MVQIILRTCGRREIRDAIDITGDRERLCYVLFEKLEPRVPGEVLQIRTIAGQQTVERDDGVAVREQTIAQMRSDEARGPGNDDSQIASPAILNGGLGNGPML